MVLFSCSLLNVRFSSFVIYYILKFCATVEIYGKANLIEPIPAYQNLIASICNRPNVVAPRPVRLANSFFQRDDLKVSFYADITDIVDKRSVLGDHLTFSHYPSSFLIYSVSSSALQTEAHGRIPIYSLLFFPVETSPPFRCHFRPLQF